MYPSGAGWTFAHELRNRLCGACLFRFGLLGLGDFERAQKAPACPPCLLGGNEYFAAQTIEGRVCAPLSGSLRYRNGFVEKLESSIILTQSRMNGSERGQLHGPEQLRAQAFRSIDRRLHDGDATSRVAAPRRRSPLVQNAPKPRSY